jgi:hypothetical protein
MIGGEVSGKLCVLSKKPGHFSKNDRNQEIILENNPYIELYIEQEDVNKNLNAKTIKTAMNAVEHLYVAKSKDWCYSIYDPDIRNFYKFLRTVYAKKFNVPLINSIDILDSAFNDLFTIGHTEEFDNLLESIGYTKKPLNSNDPNMHVYYNTFGPKKEPGVLGASIFLRTEPDGVTLFYGVKDWMKENVEEDGRYKDPYIRNSDFIEGRIHSKDMMDMSYTDQHRLFDSSKEKITSEKINNAMNAVEHLYVTKSEDGCYSIYDPDIRNFYKFLCTVYAKKFNVPLADNINNRKNLDSIFKNFFTTGRTEELDNLLKSIGYTKKSLNKNDPNMHVYYNTFGPKKEPGVLGASIFLRTEPDGVTLFYGVKDWMKEQTGSDGIYQNQHMPNNEFIKGRINSKQMMAMRHTDQRRLFDSSCSIAYNNRIARLMDKVNHLYLPSQCSKCPKGVKETNRIKQFAEFLDHVNGSTNHSNNTLNAVLDAFSFFMDKGHNQKLDKLLNDMGYTKEPSATLPKCKEDIPWETKMFMYKNPRVSDSTIFIKTEGDLGNALTLFYGARDGDKEEEHNQSLETKDRYNSHNTEGIDTEYIKNMGYDFQYRCFDYVENQERRHSNNVKKQRCEHSRSRSRYKDPK